MKDRETKKGKGAEGGEGRREEEIAEGYLCKQQ
jgi:hypothetical protein